MCVLLIESFHSASTSLRANGQHTDLKKHIVHCHGEVAGVKHQAFGEQGEQAMT